METLEWLKKWEQSKVEFKLKKDHER